MRILEIKLLQKQGYQALLSWAGTRIEARLYHEVYGISLNPRANWDTRPFFLVCVGNGIEARLLML